MARQVQMLMKELGLYPDDPDLTMTGTRSTLLQTLDRSL